MQTPSYIFKNSFGIYHLRLRVPDHLRQSLGKREIKKTLQTGCRRDALQKARRLVVEYLEQFSNANNNMNLKDILSNPLNTSLTLKSCIRRPDGTVEITGLETDPQYPEAEKALLDQLQNGVQPVTPTAAPVSPAIKPILLQELIAKYLKIISENCNAQSLTGYTAHLSTFLDILGNVYISTIDRDQARSAIEIVKQLPPNRTKYKRYDGLSPAQIADLKPTQAMSPTTVKLHIEKICALFEFAKRERHAEYNPFEGLPDNKSTVRPDLQRDLFEPSEIADLFSPENSKFDARYPSKYWIPRIAAYTGMRLEEIAQLETTDVKQINGVWIFDINANGTKNLKNKTAHRDIPIHADILPSLLKYVKTQQGNLFPELKPANGKLGHNFSKWFTRYRRSCGVTATGKTFHSFRHNFATQCKYALIHETLAAGILGHTVAGQSYGRYGKPHPPQQLLKEVIEKIDYDGNIPR